MFFPFGSMGFTISRSRVRNPAYIVGGNLCVDHGCAVGVPGAGRLPLPTSSPRQLLRAGKRARLACALALAASGLASYPPTPAIRAAGFFYAPGLPS